MIYEILDDAGAAVNRIVADEEFVAGAYPGRYRLASDQPAANPVPHTVSRRQARQALLLRGMLDRVPAAIAAIVDDTARGLAQIYWDDSQEFIRSHPLIISLGAALGLDAAALDDLFRFAGTL